MKRLLGALAVAALVLVACGGAIAPDGADGSEELVPAEAFGELFANRICAAIAPCCRTNGLAGLHERCEHAAAQANSARVAEILALPGARYDARRARRCIDAFASAWSTCGTGEAKVDHRACDGVLVGMRPAGDPCRADAECSPGARCRSSGSDLEGVCVRFDATLTSDRCLPFEAAADPGAHYRDCSAEGLYCDPLTERCRSRGAPGDACRASDVFVFGGCGSGMYCHPGSETCTLLPLLGASCPTQQCAEGAYCDGAWACVAKKPGGAPCRSPDECVFGCSPTGICLSNAAGPRMCSGGG